MTTLRFPAVLALTLALAACGGGEAPTDGEGHAAPERVEGHTLSSAGLPAGNIEAGAKLATTKGSGGQSCADCHGKDGNTPLDASYPMLGGQYADYLEYSLLGYRDGRREHALMKPNAINLTDQQIADAAAYFASQPSKLSDLSHM